MVVQSKTSGGGQQQKNEERRKIRCACKFDTPLDSLLQADFKRRRRALEFIESLFVQAPLPVLGAEGTNQTSAFGWTVGGTVGGTVTALGWPAT